MWGATNGDGLPSTDASGGRTWGPAIGAPPCLPVVRAECGIPVGARVRWARARGEPPGGAVVVRTGVAARATAATPRYERWAEARAWERRVRAAKDLWLRLDVRNSLGTPGKPCQADPQQPSPFHDGWLVALALVLRRWACWRGVSGLHGLKTRSSFVARAGKMRRVAVVCDWSLHSPVRVLVDPAFRRGSALPPPSLEG